MQDEQEAKESRMAREDELSSSSEGTAARRKRILGLFATDLPESVRAFNTPAITEELELGRDVTVEDDELPPQEVYERDKAILRDLVAEGLVNEFRVEGIACYARGFLKAPHDA